MSKKTKTYHLTTYPGGVETYISDKGETGWVEDNGKIVMQFKKTTHNAWVTLRNKALELSNSRTPIN